MGQHLSLESQSEEKADPVLLPNQSLCQQSHTFSSNVNVLRKSLLSLKKTKQSHVVGNPVFVYF